MERGDYTYRVEDFVLVEGVEKALSILKKAGYHLLVITNQAGLSRKIYSRDQMNDCHSKLQKMCDGAIDEIYYSPYHPTVTESLSRKPGTLMFERAIAKFDIDPTQSYMVGDRERDLVPARQLGIGTILIGTETSEFADDYAASLIEFASSLIPQNL